MFIDHTRIFVRGGDGGNGASAFRREKYVPMGGPSGGDGGRGGNVILEVDEGLRTLVDFRYKKHFKAARGAHGQGKNMHGASGEDLIVKVPPGTVVKDDATGEVLADLITPGQQVIIAKGGRGGRGNARFANSANRAPTMAENGEPGEERWVSLELKVLADVGLVGFPNAGKSTLISRVSAARPRIADYPFTTLYPNLGVVITKNRDSFVMADIPGLIEGAHKGVGLGLEFLRHIERTKVLLFVVDAGETEGRDVVEDLLVLREEIKYYDPSLLERPYLIVANKMDLPAAHQNADRLVKEFGKEKVFPISAITGEGIDNLIDRTYTLLQQIPAQAAFVGEEPVITRYKDEAPFFIENIDGVFQVTGKRIEKLVAMINLDNEEGLQRFQHIINRMGLEDALRAKGIKDGDTVRIKDVELIYSE